MHPKFSRAQELTGQVIAAAIEVHRHLGPGLMESLYERCFKRELDLRNLGHESQRAVRIDYKGMVFEDPLRFDMLVEDCVLVENKCVERVLPIHKAQLLSYMKLLDTPLGLIVNFHEAVLKDGLSRLILPGADRP